MFVRTESLPQFLKQYPVVSALAIINIVVFLITALPEGLGRPLYYAMVGFNFAVTEGEWWRLVTSMFVHANLWHIIFNVFALIMFSPALERLIGSVQFAVVYLLTGLIANVATWIIQDPTYAYVGASGAIFGVFGVYAAILFLYKERAPVELRQVMLPLIVIGVIMTFFQANVNMIAHFGGLAAGFGIGAFIFSSYKKR